MVTTLLLALTFFVVSVSGDCCGYRNGIQQGCAYSSFMMTCSCIAWNPPPYEGQCYECYCGPSGTFLGLVIGIPAGIIVLSIVACCFCCSCCCFYGSCRSQSQKQEVTIQQGPTYVHPGYGQPGYQSQPLLYPNSGGRAPASCKNCGSVSVETDPFCRQCGTRLQRLGVVQ